MFNSYLRFPFPSLFFINQYLCWKRVVFFLLFVFFYKLPHVFYSRILKNNQTSECSFANSKVANRGRGHIYLYINIWRMKFSHLFPFLSHVWSEIPYEPFSPSVRRSVGWLVCHVFLKGRRDSLPMLLSALLLQLSVRP